MSLDWRLMFTKYMDVVGDAEGVHFLYEEEWDEEEWSAIVVLHNELQVPKGWTPLVARRARA